MSLFLSWTTLFHGTKIFSWFMCSYEDTTSFVEQLKDLSKVSHPQAGWTPASHPHHQQIFRTFHQDTRLIQSLVRSNTDWGDYITASRFARNMDGQSLSYWKVFCSTILQPHRGPFKCVDNEDSARQRYNYWYNITAAWIVCATSRRVVNINHPHL